MSDVVLVALIAAVPGTVATIIGIFNRRKLDEVSFSVNGRLTQLLSQTAKGSFAEGVKQEADKRNEG